MTILITVKSDGNYYMRTRSKRTSLQMTKPTEKQPVLLNSIISLPRNISKTLSEKIENLMEYSYIPEDAQISQSLNPLLSPYNIFKRHCYSLRSITSLITTRRPHMKEYVQSSRMDQCSLTTTSEEQYVHIEIPEQLIRGWQQ